LTEREKRFAKLAPAIGVAFEGRSPFTQSSCKARADQGAALRPWACAYHSLWIFPPPLLVAFTDGRLLRAQNVDASI